MYPLIDQFETFEELKLLWRSSANALFPHLNQTAQLKTLQVGAAIDRAAIPHQFMRLENGALKYTYNKKLIAIFEQGDLVALDAWLPASNFALVAEFAVHCSYLDLKSEQQGTALHQFLSAHLMVTQQMTLGFLCAHLPKEGQLEPKLSFYAAGDTIISQGDQSRDVFNLVDGHANVLVDGVPVGEILPDEIFGAIAAFCETPRTATVIANKDCMVLKLPADDFMKMVNARPHSVVKLVRDLARALVDANVKITRKR